MIRLESQKCAIKVTLTVVVFILGSISLLGQNLVTNGDFESGYSNGWNHLAGDGGSATYSDETTTPYQGSHALKNIITTLGANSWSIQSLGPTVALTIGEDYTLTFWGKAAAASTQVKIVIQNSVYTATTYSVGTTWAQYTWNFTAQETSPSIRIQYPQPGTVWLDDIQLEAVTPPPPGPVQITLSPETKHQTMVGFGGALTWYSDWMYYGNKYDEINQLMFDDLGLDVLRLRNLYYPDNYPTNKTMGANHGFDSTKNFFDAAKAINPNIQVLLSSWSPPANLKSNGERPNGGTLTKDGNGYHYDEFAQYWVDCLDNLGWTPDYLSFQNEPGWVASWDSCIFDPTETASNAGYAEAADAIWNAIKDRPGVPKMIGSEAENMGAFFNLNNAITNKSYFDVNAYHCYNIGSDSAIDSTIPSLNQIRDNYSNRPNWMTEFSKSTFDWIQTARVIHNHMTEANASAYIYWKLAWTDTGGDDYMIGLTSSNFSSYTIGPHFYTLKHYAKHVDKGYTRIETSGSNANVKVSGYLSEDETKITLVAINKNTSVEQITLDHSLSISTLEGYQSVTGSYYQTMSGLDAAQPIDLPAQSMTTLVITLSAPYNSAPVANDDSVTFEKDFATDITLTGSDADGDSLTYTVVDQPTNGTLSGTAPDLTYTPNYHYSGSDSFTFKVNDGSVDSSLATVSITVNGVRVIDYTAATPGSEKTYKVALLMINTVTEPNHEPDNPVTKKLEFYSPEKLGQIFFEHEHGAAAFLHEASYGKVAIEGRVVGWIDEPTAGLNGTDISANKDYYINLAKDYLTFSDYDIFVVHSLVEGSGQQTGWLYPEQSVVTDQGTVSNIGIDWMANSAVFDEAPLNYSNWSSGDSVLPTTSWAHEILHTLGITGHANSYDCGDVTLAVDGASNPLKAYGGCFSIMGEYAFATHPDALMKSRIGWLDTNQLPEVTSSGTYEIYPLVENDGQTKALVIPLDPALTHTQHTAEFDALVIEYRTATGFDRYLQRLDGSPFLSQYTSLTDIDRNGVLIYLRYSNASTDSTALLDMNPTTTYDPARGIKWPGNPGKFADAILPVNQTFTWDNIQIMPMGTLPSGAMQVSITFPGSPIADVNLPAGISLYGYTGENPIDAEAAFQTLITNSQLSLVRWVNPATGEIKELYYTTFPSSGWVNEINDLNLGQGYVVKTTTACTLSVAGNKSTADISHNLPAGYCIIGFNRESPQDAQAAFQPLIDAGKLELVRWVDPATGGIKELYYTTFPSAGWINEIGDLQEGQGYIIKLNAAHSGFVLP